MQCTVNKSNLQTELARLQGISGRKNVPILTQALLEVEGDRLRLTVTDQETSLTCETNTELIEGDGKMMVPVKELHQIVKLLPEGQVSLTREKNDWVTVKSGRSKYKLTAEAPENFPSVPTERPSALLGLPGNDLRRLIQSTVFALPPEADTRFMMKGAKLILDMGGAKMIGTDGHRLAYASLKLKEDPLEDIDILITGSGLSEVLKLATDFEDTIYIGSEHNHLLFLAGDRFLSLLRVEGTFPAWEKVLGRGDACTKQIQFDTAELKSAIKRAAYLTDSLSIVRMTFENQELIIKAENAEKGEAKEILDTDFLGEDAELCVNSKYLEDFFSAVESKEMFFRFTNGQSAIELRAIDDQLTNRCILMPVRMKEKES